jgi:hypothetical protein
VLEVEVEMDAAEWDALRFQTRNFVEMFSGDCLAEPFGSPFSWFDASVAVDGRTAEAAIRKKGFLGSLSDTRPSLKIAFDEFSPDASLDGLRRLTLNNGIQDPSMLRQCVGYGWSASAGIPSPRCTLAHVTVNGHDLGVYSHVEGIDDEFLARQFEDPSGDLWEGTLSDFREGWLGSFEHDEGESPDTAALEAVRAAVDAPGTGSAALGAIEERVDLDAFLRFWAAEVLLGHWDGYAGNTNNFHIYFNPFDGRVAFIPWGIDGVLYNQRPFGEGAPGSVVARSALTRRLLEIPDARARYWETVTALAEDWDGDALADEVDRLRELAEPFVPFQIRPEWNDQADVLRDVVRDRGRFVQEEIEDGPPVWQEGERGMPCLRAIGEIDADFEASWGSYGVEDPLVAGDAAISVVWDGTPVGPGPGGAVAGPVGPEQPGVGVLVLDAEMAPQTYALPWITFPVEQMQPGAILEIDHSSASGWFHWNSPDTGGEWRFIAWIADGDLRFDDAAPWTGEPVTGSLSGDLLVWGW